MAEERPTERPPALYIPEKKPKTEFPLIDNDPHIARVIRFARTSDYVAGGLLAAGCPAMLAAMEMVSPSMVGKGGFASVMRLTAAGGLCAGFLLCYQRSTFRFYGLTENSREVAMDMREMVDKVKRGEPLYGKTELSDYMQGVAHRNSRYTANFIHVIPMFNFTNHNQVWLPHGVDTAKYYQQAERELEAERLAKGVTWKDGQV